MTYKAEPSAGIAGAIVNTEHKNIVSRTVENAAGVKFGKPVAKGSADKSCRPTKAGDTRFIGITVVDRTATGVADDQFNQYEGARVLEEGVIWVEVAEAVTAGDPVVVDVVAGTFIKTAAAEKIAWDGVVYDTSADAGSIAQVRIK